MSTDPSIKAGLQRNLREAHQLITQLVEVSVGDKTAIKEIKTGNKPIKEEQARAFRDQLIKGQRAKLKQINALINANALEKFDPKTGKELSSFKDIQQQCAFIEAYLTQLAINPKPETLENLVVALSRVQQYIQSATPKITSEAPKETPKIKSTPLPEAQGKGAAPSAPEAGRIAAVAGTTATVAASVAPKMGKAAAVTPTGKTPAAAAPATLQEQVIATPEVRPAQVVRMGDKKPTAEGVGLRVESQRDYKEINDIFAEIISSEKVYGTQLRALLKMKDQLDSAFGPEFSRAISENLRASDNYLKDIESRLPPLLGKRRIYDPASLDKSLDALNIAYLKNVRALSTATVLGAENSKNFIAATAKNPKLKALIYQMDKTLKFVPGEKPGEKVPNPETKGQGLESLQILPVQRFPRHKLLTDELLKQVSNPKINQGLGVEKSEKFNTFRETTRNLIKNEGTWLNETQRLLELGPKTARLNPDSDTMKLLNSIAYLPVLGFGFIQGVKNLVTNFGKFVRSVGAAMGLNTSVLSGTNVTRGEVGFLRDGLQRREDGMQAVRYYRVKAELYPTPANQLALQNANKELETLNNPKSGEFKTMKDIQNRLFSGNTLGKIKENAKNEDIEITPSMLNSSRHNAFVSKIEERMVQVIKPEVSKPFYVDQDAIEMRQKVADLSKLKSRLADLKKDTPTPAAENAPTTSMLTAQADKAKAAPKLAEKVQEKPAVVAPKAEVAPKEPPPPPRKPKM